jgi:hypothetical protein
MSEQIEVSEQGKSAGKNVEITNEEKKKGNHYEYYALMRNVIIIK